jgi:uncharacterized protein (TIGR02145 family)
MKQRKRKTILLMVALSGLSVMGYAQGKVCQGTTYTIKELQAPSAPSTFQWVVNGKDIDGAKDATYTIPETQAVGRYTYLRNSLKEGCEWASSNAYTVEVIVCGTVSGTDDDGTMGSFEDPRDGKLYKIVKMPDGKVWFAENLNYQKGLTFNQRADVANGAPFITADNGIPAIGSFWCPPISGNVTSTDKNTCSVYGALYTWETAMMVDGNYSDETKVDSSWNESWVSGNYFASNTAPAEGNNGNINNARDGRGICPVGWHVPTDYEWANMLDKVEGNTTYTSQTSESWWGTDAGQKLKSASTYLSVDPGNGAWIDDSNRGTDFYGFAVTPSGYRGRTATSLSGRGSSSYLWTSTVVAMSLSPRFQFQYNYASVHYQSSYRAYAFSVRCVKD